MLSRKSFKAELIRLQNVAQRVGYYRAMLEIYQIPPENFPEGIAKERALAFWMERVEPGDEYWVARCWLRVFDELDLRGSDDN